MKNAEDRRVDALEGVLRHACGKVFPAGWGAVTIHVLREGIRRDSRDPANDVMTIGAFCQTDGQLPYYPAPQDVTRLLEGIRAVWP